MFTNFLIRKYVKEVSDLKDPEIRKKLGSLCGTIGILSNLVLSAAKFFAGVITSSIAVSADAFNNLSDAISSVVTLVCFKTSNSPADREHPFGHGRIEYISGLIVSITIIFMGIEFLKSSIEKIFTPEPISINITSVIILFLSLIVKFWAGIFNTKISKMINSTAIKAAAFDSKNDAVVTLTILIGMAITYFTGISVDAYSGIVVAAFIIYTGCGALKETINPLLGDAPNTETVKYITNLTLKCPDILGIHDLAVHNYGPGKWVISLHAEVPANKSIIELYDSINSIKEKLEQKFSCQATIHMDPAITDDAATNLMREKISALVKLIDESAKIYNMRIIKGPTQTLVFHVSVPYDLKKSDKELKKSLSKGICAIDDSYKCMITVDRVYIES